MSILPNVGHFRPILVHEQELTVLSRNVRYLLVYRRVEVRNVQQNEQKRAEMSKTD